MIAPTFSTSCTDFYAPEDERAILWNDPELAVAWPLPPGAEPVLSARDAAARSLRDAECYPVNVLLTGAAGSGGARARRARPPRG